MTFQEIKQNWNDTTEYHQYINESLKELVNDTWGLNDHRTYVENNIFGMGERSFWWLWKLILQDLPQNPKLCEIGVFKGATISLWKMLREDAQVFGVTPLDGRGTGWTEDDYLAHITKIHHDFGLEMPTLFVGGSAEPDIVEKASQHQYDILYVDGDHSHDGALFDLVNYTRFIKSDGYLVVDDAACRTNQPFGYFQGIDTVCSALSEWEQSEIAKYFEFQFNVVHLMIYKRVK